ncbi:SOS response-associated peptidase [Achromobacter sp. Marseille-Q0513]|uniref:SOS response-associated peptidase n=1 Tax=Achromobacter sp. Marseille-Q0513 TaxID=2829161 RepID=UPI001B8FF600|nr:SOS response-associated peptidase [Achromobacter sp. Marseille-Q0513]MBR8657103.1 SOS response-associated peptidase [Achromobacter sp. Marseille-Q0513]
MCGRIVQKSGPLDYVERIFPNLHRIFDDPAGPRYNIPPGTRPLTMHRLAGAFDLDRQHWGWRPSGSKYLMSNARLDKIQANKWPWKLLTGHGRILVPADGWYEWQALDSSPKPPKQPYFIHAADSAPLFFAGLSNWRPGTEKDEAHGFAIVTDDSAGGMVDVHDRRPVALPADLAIHWLDPDFPVTQALELLQHGLPETAFQWHPVRPEVGNSKYQMPDAIDPAPPI